MHVRNSPSRVRPRDDRCVPEMKTWGDARRPPLCPCCCVQDPALPRSVRPGLCRWPRARSKSQVPSDRGSGRRRTSRGLPVPPATPCPRSEGNSSSEPPLACGQMRVLGCRPRPGGETTGPGACPQGWPWCPQPARHPAGSQEQAAGRGEGTGPPCPRGALTQFPSRLCSPVLGEREPRNILRIQTTPCAGPAGWRDFAGRLGLCPPPPSTASGTRMRMLSVGVTASPPQTPIQGRSGCRLGNREHGRASGAPACGGTGG